MICIGSMGDVRPYIVLGRELKKRGHDIAICAFASFADTVKKENMRFKPISGNVSQFMANIMKPGAKGVAFLKEVKDSFIDIRESFLGDLEAACDDAEAVIATFFGQVFQSIAEVRHVPYIQTQYYPMDMNSMAPISSAPGQRAGRAWNLTTYQLGYLLISLIEKTYLAQWRSSRGMSPRKLHRQPDYMLNGHVIPVVYAMSPLVMPRPTTWGENIHMTGAWLDDQQSDYQPSAELKAFLDAGKPPVYIGFGSMTGNNTAKIYKVVRDAVRSSGTRAILCTGWSKTDVQSEHDLCVVSFVPHDWLFPRVSAVVHHGGAGTTAAGLEAGKPTLIIPFGGDQPFWGERVRALGVGPKPIPRERLSATKLAKALHLLTSTRSYQVAARELGEHMRAEHGVEIAANIIEHELRKWLRDEHRDPAILPSEKAGGKQ